MAQERKVVHTSRGEKFEGTITQQKDDLITMSIEGGEVKIPASIVTKIGVEHARLQIIVMHDKDIASRVYELLNLGADFTEMAKKYSHDLATWFQDGKTGFVRRDYLPRMVAATVFSLPEGRHTYPVNAGDAFHIVKILEKKYLDEKAPKPREVKPEKPRTPELPEDQQIKPHGTRPAGSQLTDIRQEERPARPEAPKHAPVRVAILPITESTRDARENAKGLEVQDILVSEISSTTGLDAFALGRAPEPGAQDTTPFLVQGEVAVDGLACAVEFVLKDKDGKTLFPTHRLTAIGDRQFFEAVKILARRLAREIRKSR